jgi:hypothetical protein
MKVVLGSNIDFTNKRDVSEIIQKIEQAFDRIRLDDQIIIGGGTPILKHLSETATWDPANLAAAAQTSTTVALTGAALGDEVTCSFSLDLQLLQLTGYVSATDVVTVVLRNGTAGAINLGSGTLRVSVWQH